MKNSEEMSALTSPLALTSQTLVTALGRSLANHRRALQERQSGLTHCDLPHADLDTMIGRVAGLEDEPLTGDLAAFDCRNNRLAVAALEADGFNHSVQAAIDRHGADRIAVVVGSSTSGIDRTEAAYRARQGTDEPLPGWFDYQHTQNAFSPADLTRSYFGLEGMALAVATACSSAAKAMATAARYIEADLADAAVIGGVDCLCLTTIYGFNSLELLDNRPCRPWDQTRSGISLGEAAGFVLMERGQGHCADGGNGLSLLGYGESSDAHHMSAPPPDGAGAARAIDEALAMSGLEARDIDYVNLHGTGTASNDSAEDCAVVSRLGRNVPCSSTKGLTGHTLGASGMVELVLTSLAMQDGFIPGTMNTKQVDESLQAAIELDNRNHPINHALSNSFGFGGSNCSLILGYGPNAGCKMT
ncbi:MAG: beta-ketoacyl-ACP synthase [Geminicoccales bacterium]